MTSPDRLGASLAADGRSLDGLKREAVRDPQGALRKAALQFESLFMQMVLKSMRDAVPKSGLFDSPAHDMYAGMLDQQLSGRLAGGTGLAEAIARQLSRQTGLPDNPAGAAAAGSLPRVPTVPASAAGLRHGANAVSQYRAVAGAEPGGAASAAQPPGAGVQAAERRAAQRDFVTRHWDHALNAERATGVPARHIVSQAALESGWGRREIRGPDGLPSHNLFGIKAGAGWQGRTVDVVTTEYEDGVARRVVQKFRAYTNYGEAFRDWARLMAGNPRYAGVLAGGGSAEGFARGLQQAGYATDPGYAAKLERIIDSVQTLRSAA